MHDNRTTLFAWQLTISVLPFQFYLRPHHIMCAFSQYRFDFWLRMFETTSFMWILVLFSVVVDRDHVILCEIFANINFIFDWLFETKLFYVEFLANTNFIFWFIVVRDHVILCGSKPILTLFFILVVRDPLFYVVLWPSLIWFLILDFKDQVILCGILNLIVVVKTTSCYVAF